MDAIAEVIAALEKASGCDELVRVTKFKGYRTGPHGRPVEVTIEVQDDGVDGPYRWNVTARDEEGRMATGNGASELHSAIAIVHWADLDRRLPDRD